MSTAIYKKGQGYWTRQMSTIAGGLIILLGAMWFSDFFKNSGWFELDPIYFRAIAGVLWVGIFGFLLYYFISDSVATRKSTDRGLSQMK